MAKQTQIPISIETRERLKQAGIKGETYDTIIRRLLKNQKEEKESD